MNNSGATATTEYVTSLATVLAYALAVVLGMAIAETLFSSPVSDRLSGTDVTTSVGVGAVVVTVLLVTAVASGTAVGMLIDDDSSDDEESESDTSDLEDAQSDDTDDNDKDDGEPYAPEDYDTTGTSPWISTATFLESPTDDVSLNCGGEPEALPDGTGPAYAVAETHTDGAAVTVSNVEVESEGETVVPDAHYAVDIEGVDIDGGYVILSNVYDENTLEEGADASLWQGSAVSEDYGFFLKMPRVESTSVYMDVVTEDREIHRYIVEVCREDV